MVLKRPSAVQTCNTFWQCQFWTGIPTPSRWVSLWGGLHLRRHGACLLEQNGALALLPSQGLVLLVSGLLKWGHISPSVVEGPGGTLTTVLQPAVWPDAQELISSNGINMWYHGLFRFGTTLTNSYELLLALLRNYAWWCSGTIRYVGAGERAWR